jgi:4-hydroxyphenylpyruvate dioxygenase-like putative hemolysin
MNINRIMDTKYQINLSVKQNVTTKLKHVNQITVLNNFNSKQNFYKNLMQNNLRNYFEN